MGQKKHFKSDYLTVNIRELRKDKGLTQGQAAIRIGVSRVGWACWELGKNDPDTGTYLKICEKFNVDPLKFYNDPY